MVVNFSNTFNFMTDFLLFYSLIIFFIDKICTEKKHHLLLMVRVCLHFLSGNWGRSTPGGHGPVCRSGEHWGPAEAAHPAQHHQQSGWAKGWEASWLESRHEETLLQVCCLPHLYKKHSYNWHYEQQVKVKVGAYAMVQMALVFMSLSLALDHVVGQNLLPWDTGPVWHPGYLSTPSSGVH